MPPEKTLFRARLARRKSTAILRQTTLVTGSDGNMRGAGRQAQRRSARQAPGAASDSGRGLLPQAGRRIQMKINRSRAILVVVALLSLALSGCSKEPEDSVTLKPQPSSSSNTADDVPTSASLLAKAAIRGDMVEIRSLLDAGAQINVTDALGRTPLHMAAFYGRSKASELLLANGASIDARDRVGMTPLHAAVLSGGRHEVELLLDKKADANAKTDTGQSPLHLAAATGQPNVSRVLIEHGADPRSRDKNGKTPLFYAMRNKHPMTTEVLQQYGAKE
jgi:hypothetical protein